MIGKNINGFQIIEKLGQGGMADVYKAVDLKLEREVAIKFLRTDPKDFKKGSKRFEIEAKALAKLRHPNIVSVQGYGEFEGQPYLVMEYVPGGTLKAQLGKPIPWNKAASLLAPIARALHYAHSKNIVHRDVKPSNILINADGEPMLSDFGVAKILGSEETMDLTGTSVGIGTPYYMSPEQCRNKQIGPKSDIYSLGVVFFEMITGTKPYEAETPLAVILKHIEEPLPSPSKTRPGLSRVADNIVFTALAKDPKNRYKTMHDMAAALEKAASGSTPMLPLSRRTWLVIGTSLVLLGAIYATYRMWPVNQLAEIVQITTSPIATTDTADDQATALISMVPAGQELADAYGGMYSGTVVSIAGPFADQDEVTFNNSITAFEKATGIDIQYEGYNEFEASITVRVDAGDAPDIADFPQPGLLATAVKKGQIVDLNTVINNDWLHQNLNAAWLEMGTMDGPDGSILAGLFARANGKSFVFYPKAAFDAAGYEIPTTWDEMMALTQQIADDGDTAWCIGIESGGATGWPMTDWVEDVMLRTTSLENYDKWVAGELKFNSPEVKHALSYITAIWFNDAYVYGGRVSIPTTSFGDAPAPMFDNPPGCWLHRQGNWITSFFPENAIAGVDYDFFYLPPIDQQYGKPVLGGGDFYAMFNDRPEVRAVMQFFSTGDSIIGWVKAGGVIAPYNDISLDSYADPVTRGVAEIMLSADSFRFDGSDLMPQAVGQGTFWKYMTDYVSGTIDEETTLQQIDAYWSTE